MGNRFSGIMIMPELPYRNYSAFCASQLLPRDKVWVHKTVPIPFFRPVR